MYDLPTREAMNAILAATVHAGECGKVLNSYADGELMTNDEWEAAVAAPRIGETPFNSLGLDDVTEHIHGVWGIPDMDTDTDYQELLRLAVDTIKGLSYQQAMPDGSYLEPLSRIEDALGIGETS